MGLIQQAYETYLALEDKYSGLYSETLKEPLCPISHIITAAQIEITLDAQGNFVNASAVDKSEPKIIIPATEESAGRTSGACAHPLCEQLGYIGGYNEKKFELYIRQLEKWTDSPYTHPKLNAVLAYVKSGTVLSDLERFGIIKLDGNGIPENEKLLVRWRILDPHSSNPEECWKDKTLFKAFEGYYGSFQGSRQLCMVSGDERAAAKQHPKGIISFNGNAKLISSNDESGFTYRGRFTEDWQAASVSYEVSQKAHAALRWLAVNQGFSAGGRMFICWNPDGFEIVKPHTSLLRSSGKKLSDYREELRQTILGHKEKLPENAKAVIAAFDAATPGRLAITYYNELQASDFLDRLHDWDESCCWWMGKDHEVQSPYLAHIVDCAFGVQRNEKGTNRLVTDDRVMAQQFQRLLSCRLDSKRMPEDIMRAVVNKASNPTALDGQMWRNVVHTACAVIQKYYAPILKEDICMEWELDRKDRSFQFGRLLAVMERVEEDYYRSINEDRQTSAIKSLSSFKQTPWSVFERVNEHLSQAYLPRVKPWQRDRYKRLTGEITAMLSSCSKKDLNAPLDPFYLIGYELQRNEFFNHKPETTENEEE